MLERAQVGAVAQYYLLTGRWLWASPQAMPLAQQQRQKQQRRPVLAGWAANPRRHARRPRKTSCPGAKRRPHCSRRWGLESRAMSPCCC